MTDPLALDPVLPPQERVDDLPLERPKRIEAKRAPQRLERLRVLGDHRREHAS